MVTSAVPFMISFDLVVCTADSVSPTCARILSVCCMDDQQANAALLDEKKRSSQLDAAAKKVLVETLKEERRALQPAASGSKPTSKGVGVSSLRVALAEQYRMENLRLVDQWIRKLN